MKNNYWKENKKVFVNSKLPNCSANNYYKPQINKVASHIDYEDDFFVPEYSNSYGANIYSNVPENLLKINNLQTSIVDCGFSIKLPVGYKICFSLESDLSNKGLFISGHSEIDHEKESRIKIFLFNVGDMVTIKHKQKLGLIWAEPIYYFEWTKL